MSRDELFELLDNTAEEWTIDYVQKLRGVARDILNGLSDSIITQEEIEEYLRKQEALFVERMESSIDDIKAEIENLIENGGDQKEGILSQLSETFNDIYHKMVANLRKLVNK
tara:strand:+ start:616 stop:951 length:336 start_codon:yes stop_codon:yes gene_type:complete